MNWSSRLEHESAAEPDAMHYVHIKAEKVEHTAYALTLLLTAARCLQQAQGITLRSAHKEGSGKMDPGKGQRAAIHLSGAQRQEIWKIWKTL